jgi:hypothetical protein
VGGFGCGSVMTCWRRFAEWAHADEVVERLQQLLLDERGARGAAEREGRRGRVVPEGVTAAE